MQRINTRLEDAPISIAALDAMLEQAYENGKQYEEDMMLVEMGCGHPLAVSEETAGGKCYWCESLEAARAEERERLLNGGWVEEAAAHFRDVIDHVTHGKGTGYHRKTDIEGFAAVIRRELAAAIRASGSGEEQEE